LQVIARSDGSVVYSDLLPLQPAPSTPMHAPPTRRSFLSRTLLDPSPSHQHAVLDSAASYTLLSSFAVPRMDNALESEQGGTHDDGMATPDAGPVSLFSAPEVKRVFRDPHLLWSMDQINFSIDDSHVKQEEKGHTDNHDDAASVDSECYDFGLSKPAIPPRINNTSVSLPPLPPVILLASSHDAVTARVCTIDDAIAHAQEQNKPAHALRHALRHLRQVRRYRLDDLVDDYLCALLRIRKANSATTDATTESKTDKPLSMRRMRLAAEALPILLGGNVTLWEHWVQEFSQIPGSLFAVRKHLPVRGTCIFSVCSIHIVSTTRTIV
jgi:hypothetical protein